METLPPASSNAVRAPMSAAEAIMPALQNVKRVLLSPFSVRKWLKLGLIAFLAGVMGGGGSGGGGGPSGTGGLDFDHVGRQIVEWYQAHTDAIIAGAVGLGIVGLAVFLIMLYVSSIFRFIFMESVITTETRIRESWHRNKAEGLAYMWWRIGFGLASLLLVALLVGGPVTILVLFVIGPARGGGFTAVGGAIVLVLVAIFFALICALVIGLISAMTRDFVLPLMYLRRIGAVAGWRAFWPILCGNKLGFLIYFLLKVVLAIAAGIAGMFGAIIGLLVAVIPLALIGLIGWGIVLLLGITAWNWWYLAVLIPVGLVIAMLLGYWMTCVLLPIPVWFQSYALKYLGYVEPTAETI